MPKTNRIEIQDIVDAIEKCASECRKCAADCLEEEGIAGLRECIRLNRDCAWICDMSAAYMLGNSPFQIQACQLCAEVSEACAIECEKHTDMEHCRECAEACRRCVEACRAMAGIAV